MRLKIIASLISLAVFVIQSEPSGKGIINDINDNCGKNYRVKSSSIRCSPIKKAEVESDDNQTITENF